MRKIDNHNDNEIEDDATMLEGTNAVRGVELEWYDCSMALIETDKSIK